MGPKPHGGATYTELEFKRMTASSKSHAPITSESQSMKKIVLYAASASLIVGLVVFFLWPRLSIFFEEEVYIALVGDMSSGNEAGKEMRNAVNMYVDKINETGGVNGKKLKLLVFNDKNDVKKAIQIASRIVETQDILMVLGHDWSLTSVPAGKIYKKYGIPAITGSALSDAVTKKNDWYFSIIMDTSFLGAYMSNYMHHVLQHKTVSVILSNSSYASNIFTSFEKSARKLGTTIKRKWVYDLGSDRLREDLIKIVSELRSMKDPGVIFLISGAFRTAEFLTLLRNSGKKYSIFITDPFLENSFELFNKSSQEKASPGFFSNGIYSPVFFMEDIANEKFAVFKKEYLKKYGESPGWYGPYYYDVATVAIEAMRRGEIQGKGHVRRDREEIRKALGGMYNSDTGINGLNGHIYFDKNGVSNRPASMGFYRSNNLLPGFTQYQLTETDWSGEDLVKKNLSGELILVGDRMMRKSRVVYADININEISNLNMEKSSYFADLYLKFSYEGDFDDVSSVVFLNATVPVQLDKPISRIKEGKFSTVTYHIKDRFNVEFDFEHYPFDRQKLEIQFKHEKLSRDQLVYIANSFSIPDPDSEEVKLKGWRIIEESFNESIVSYSNSKDVFGNSDLNHGGHYSKCAAGITITKNLGGTIIKTFGPIFFLFLVLCAVYFIDVDKFLFRMMIPLSVLIATAFYHAAIWRHLGVAYMAAIEYAYLAIYMIVALTLAMVLSNEYFHKRKQSTKARRISYACMMAHSLIVLILFFWFIFG